MPPPPDSAPDTDHPLRRQLILAQVQLMELEDTRDDLQTRLASAATLLTQAQQQADRALLEQDNLAAQLRARDTTLEAVRAELAAAGERERALVDRIATLEAGLAQVERVQRDTDALLATRETRLAQLEQERRELKSSRSWRYTAPLRSLERALRRGGRAG